MSIQIISFECSCDIFIQIFYCQLCVDILRNGWGEHENVINVFNLPARAWVSNWGPTCDDIR